MCFAVLARRMTTFLTTNQYIDTSVQKGGFRASLAALNTPVPSVRSSVKQR
ncbi:hypothetical protein DPMN_186178 [Dreissena polymorpha]|uniref:Uncharacterized protein n=1 Tax=Dreissena polymorpha TaxID=45954 RepID=A0A9D4DNN4_DREPO|nr:hypothetical protein DPMN_186178 [Dreissena polymorpha]